MKEHAPPYLWVVLWEYLQNPAAAGSFCAVPADIPMGRAMVISPDSRGRGRIFCRAGGYPYGEGHGDFSRLRRAPIRL